MVLTKVSCIILCCSFKQASPSQLPAFIGNQLSNTPQRESKHTLFVSYYFHLEATKLYLLQKKKKKTSVIWAITFKGGTFSQTGHSTLLQVKSVLYNKTARIMLNIIVCASHNGNGLALVHFGNYNKTTKSSLTKTLYIIHLHTTKEIWC